MPSENVEGENFEPQAITTPAPGDVWIVGYHEESVGGAIEFRTLAEHDEDGRFTVVPTPDSEIDQPVDLLMGASGTSADDLWVVGYSSPGGTPAQTLIEHWNGSVWSLLKSPNPGANGDILEGVSAISPRDAWAVGARQNQGSFFQRPMALHWNGTAWSSVPVPNAAECSGHSYLTSVSAASSTDVWAAGWCGSGGDGTAFAYIDHWNGSTWTVSAGQATTMAGSQLYGISAAGGNVWAVGFVQKPGGSPAVAMSLRLNHGAWESVAVPLAGTPNPAAVVAVPGGGAWSVGSAQSPQPPFAGPFAMQFAAGSWQRVTVPLSFARLSSVALGSAGAVWATGWTIPSDGFDQSLVLVHR